jgi:hypothetical protein
LTGVFVGIYFLLFTIINRAGLANQTSAFGVALVAGLIVGLPSGMLAAVLAGYTTRLATLVARRLHMATSSGLDAGLCVGASIGLAVFVVAGPVKGLQAGLAFGVGVGLLFAMAKRVVIVERLRWSWRSGLSTAIFVGLCYSLALVLEGILWPSVSDKDLQRVIGEALRTIFSFSLIMGITGGEIEQRTRPNQGIRRSAQNALWGIVAGIFAGLFVMVVGSMIVQQNYIGQAFATGAIVALLCALRGGLLPCIQHSLLRAMLYSSRVIPRKYIHFLDYAVDRIFLRRVGGGYIFGHRLLMEYFAQQNGRILGD